MWSSTTLHKEVEKHENYIQWEE